MLSIFPSTTRNSSFDLLSREMDRLLEATSAWASPRGAAAGAAPSQWPGLNVWRDGEELAAEAEIPGFRMEDVEVLATEDTLTLRGKRESAAPEGATALRVERSVSRFERSLRLPAEIDPDAVEATLSNGVLRVTMPVAEAARPRRVQVRSLASGPGQEALPDGSSGRSEKPAEASTA